MSVRIAGAGLQTTVQDLGRVGHQREAVPAGGAMDRLACRAANLLVGNDDDAAVLEASLVGPSIEFLDDTLCAIGGGDLEAVIDDTPIPLWHPVFVPRGARLRFGQAVRGCRAYIALAGGVDIAPVFGSRSTYLRGGFGGFEGRALRSGDVVATCAPSPLSLAIAAALRGRTPTVAPTPPAVPRVARWSLGATLRPRYAADVVARVVEGAHARYLSEAAREQFFGERFRLSSSSDRMGYRLEGPAVSLDKSVELLSEGVAFGTIQLPPGGAPIILMADRQTTGGYPRLGEVASVDLPLIAQLRPGDTVRFRPITVGDAQRLYLAEQAELSQMRAGIALRFSHGRTA